MIGCAGMGYRTLARAALETARISVPTIVDAAFGRTSYARCDRRLDSWSERLVKEARISLRLKGQEFLQPGQSYVVMSNHQSHYDIPVVFQALRVPLRMVAKRELFKIPIMGQAMLDSGFIRIDRDNRRKAVQQLKMAQARITEHSLSVWIAPEGTRSLDGRLGEFKPGGFHLALGSGVQVLPVTIDGTILVHRSGDSRVHKDQTVNVTLHRPINAMEYGRPKLAALVADVRAQIASALPDHYALTSS